MEKDLEFEGKHGGIYRSIWGGGNLIKIQSQKKKKKKKQREQFTVHSPVHVLMSNVFHGNTKR